MALTLHAFPASSASWFSFPCPVLLSFIDNDIQRPVIIGFIHDRLFNRPGQDTEIDALVTDHYQSHTLTSNFIRLQGKDEIQLECGKSSLSLKRDGQVIIKGEKITNRARRVNKIKGANVKIN